MASYDGENWVKLHRKIRESDVYMMPPLYLRVFERLIIEANHKEKEIPYKYPGEKTIGKKTIKRGERLTSIRQIARWVGWYERGIFREPNTKTIKTILDWLEENNMLKIYDHESNRQGTIYKVVNYDVYQKDNSGKVTVSKQSGNSQETVDGSKQEVIRMNKNVKNDKKKRVPPLSPPKKNYAEFVELTEEEYDRLTKQYGRDATDTMIEILDNYKGSTGKKYKDDNRAIRSWVVKRYEDDKAKGYLRKNKDEPKAWDTLRDWLEEKEAGEKHYDL